MSQQEQSDIFWLVFTDPKDLIATIGVPHETKETAKAEAGILAREHPGKAVYVLKSIGKAYTYPNPVSYIDFGDGLRKDQK